MYHLGSLGSVHYFHGLFSTFLIRMQGTKIVILCILVNHLSAPCSPILRIILRNTSPKCSEDLGNTCKELILLLPNYMVCRGGLTFCLSMHKIITTSVQRKSYIVTYSLGSLSCIDLPSEEPAVLQVVLEYQPKPSSVGFTTCFPTIL